MFQVTKAERNQHFAPKLGKALIAGAKARSGRYVNASFADLGRMQTALSQNKEHFIDSNGTHNKPLAYWGMSLELLPVLQEPRVNFQI